MRSFFQLVVATLAAVAGQGEAVPAIHGHQHTHAVRSTTSNRTDAAAGDFYLRVMALGASITYGFKSADGNGFRKVFRQALRAKGWQVNMVGDVNAGRMKDNDNEGHPGFRVDQMMSVVNASVPRWKPNVVLVNCGTNDAYQSYEVDGTGARMGLLLDSVWSVVPEAVVVLSTLLPQAKNPGGVESINGQYRTLATGLQAAGRKVVLAEMNDGWIQESDLVDGVHPGVAGYMRMAARFSQAVQIANNRGWLTAPVAMGQSDAATPDADKCRKTSDEAVTDAGEAGTQVLLGTSAMVVDDGPYVHASVSRGSVLHGRLGAHETVLFAQLVATTDAEAAQRSAVLDELVYTVGGQAYMRLNEGNGTFGEAVAVTTNVDCDADGLRFGDINGDGLDDCLCVAADGSVAASVNRGQNPPAFSYVGVIREAPASVWNDTDTDTDTDTAYNRSSVRLGDVDGDGRLDYCVTGPTAGALTCERNGGTGDRPAYWEAVDSPTQTTTFVDALARDAAGVRLGDLNGDGRADWLWLDDEGRITTMLNERADSAGLRPAWWDMGVTHGGMDAAGARARVRLGRVFGSGRLDYGFFAGGADNGSLAGLSWELRLWENTGGGGRWPKGDGVRFCDMDGSGTDDYVFVDGAGQLTVFRNPHWAPAPARAVSSAGWAWDAHAAVLQTGVADRATVQLADWTGDGRCDVLVTDGVDGGTYLWATGFDGVDDAFAYGDRQLVAGATAATAATAGSTTTASAAFSVCSEASGRHPDDRAVRYADLDGDGRADYLCIAPDGRTTAWLHAPNGSAALLPVHQVVPAQPQDAGHRLDRASMRFADVDGDGRADLLWLDRASGSALVWYNDGYNASTAATAASSDCTWAWDRRPDPVFVGATAAANLRWADLAGRGRADLVHLRPASAQGWLSLNACASPAGSVGGDDGPLIDPGLPQPPDDGDTAVYGL